MITLERLNLFLEFNVDNYPRVYRCKVCRKMFSGKDVRIYNHVQKHIVEAQKVWDLFLENKDI